MDTRTLAAAIDHTALKPNLTTGDIAQLCEEAILHRFAAVCVPPCYVRMACGLLENSGIEVATVIGFPLGYNTASAKVSETIDALDNGAGEIDMVHNISFIKSEDYDAAVAEIREIANVVHGRGKKVKVILETSYLSDAEIAKCCQLYGALGVDFVKTSTGFSNAGAKAETVTLMRQNLPESVQIKASGGIRTYDEALSMLRAGATRLGCSAGVTILKESAHKTFGA